MLNPEDGFTADDAPNPDELRRAVEDRYVDYVARQFHETYERLASAHGYETRAESAVPWDQVPDVNRNLMRDVVTVLLDRGVVCPGTRPVSDGEVADPATPAPATETISYATSERGEIAVRFTYHPPVGDQPARYERLRAEARGLAETIDDLCPESREKAFALTNLEQAVMWANAAIARREPRDR